jgi:hypothetical protein
MSPSTSDNHLVRIRVNDQIGVVRDDYDLASRLCIANMAHQLIKDGFRVEVLLGLVYHQRAVILIVYREI